MFRRLCCFILITAVLSEPECSRYHYEEQTLNKVIRQEIAMEKLKSDMLATQQHVSDAIRELKETREQLRDEWGIVETSLKQVADDMVAKTDKSILKYSSEVERPKGLSVAFRSKDLTDTTPSSGETLVFKTTTLNEGLGYDNMTGVFTAPVAGTYTFSAQFCVNGGKNMYYAIVSDDVEIKKGWFCDEKWATCYTTDTVAVLQIGSKVHLKCSYSSSSLTHSKTYWNTFSGALVHVHV